MKEFKLGDKVKHPILGEGEVSGIYPLETFTVEVSFDSGRVDFFTHDGRFWPWESPTLKHIEL